MLLLWVTAARSQQNTADILGTVTDTSGAVVPNATVTLTNTGTNISQTSQSNGTGDYTFTLVQVGNYAIKVQANGFKTYAVRAQLERIGWRSRPALTPKWKSALWLRTVEVQATSTPALQTDRFELEHSCDHAAGRRPAAERSQNCEADTKVPWHCRGHNEWPIVVNATRSIVVAVSSFTANGQDESINNNLIDGLDNNERVIGGNVARPLAVDRYPGSQRGNKLI